jgi:hypothetical protein
MFKLFLLFICFYTASIASDVDKAWAFFQSEDYEKAQELFQKLLKDAETPEERSIISNNLAVIQARQGKLQGSRDILEVVDLVSLESPYIIREINLNLAILYHKIALSFLKDIKEEGSLEEFIEMIDLLELGLKKLELALLEEERISIIEVKSIATVEDEKADQLNKKIKTLILKFKEKKEEFQFKQLSKPVLVEKLQKNSVYSISTLEETGLKNFDLSLEKRFATNWYLLQQEQNKYWDLGEKELDSERFIRAANLNREALDYLKEGSLWPAKIASQKSELLLRSTLNELKEKDPLPSLLNQRLKWVQNKGEIDSEFYQESIKQEHLFLLELVNDYLEIEESNLKEGEELKKKLMLLLRKQFENIELPNQEQAEYDLALYEQIGTEETETFLNLLNNISYIPLKALHKKVYLRASLEDKPHIIEVSNLLALQVDVPKDLWNENESKRSLDQAFLLWDSNTYLNYKLTKLKKKFSALLQRGRISSKASDHLLDETQQTYRKCSEALEYIELEEEVKEQIIKMLTYILNDTLQGSQASENVRVFFFNDALFWIKRLQFLLQGDSLKGVDWLKEAIAEERVSLTQNEDLQGFQRLRVLSSEMKEILLLTQKVALHEVHYALKMLQEEEEVNLDAIKLIEEGIKEAEKVFPYLELEIPEFIQAYPKQKLAMTHWIEALDLIDNSKDEKDDSEKNPPSESSQENQPALSDMPQELLELYQQMQDEDAPTSKETKSVIKQGLRPW